MDKQKFYAELRRRDTADVLKLAQELIRIPSFSGQEDKAVKHVAAVAKKLGFDNVYTSPMGCFIGEMIFGNGTGPKIVLTGHLDTVGVVEEEWSKRTPAFEGNIINGRLYGRGASDMKSSDAAMIYAIAETSKYAKDVNARVYYVGTVVEEFFEGVAFLEAISEINPDYVIVGEASQRRIQIGQRGRAEVMVTSYGQPQHASTGREVINAIEQAAYIIDQFHRWYRSPDDEILGKRNVVPVDIKIPVGGGGGLDGRGGNSTVPSKVELNYDIRTLAGDTEETILSIIRYNLGDVVKKGRTRYPNFKNPKIEMATDKFTTYTGAVINQPKFAPAWKTPEDSNIVTAAKRALENVGQEVKLGSYKFCTDGSGVVRYEENNPGKHIEIIGYGPGNEKDAHTVNESIYVEEIDKAFKGFAGIITELITLPLSQYPL